MENQTFDVSLLLGGGYGIVHGVVLDASFNPVPDAVIGGGPSLVNAGPDGSFTMTDIPVGRTRLVAVSNALQTDGETSVDIVQNGESVNATIVLQPVGSVAGIVRDRDGVPQSGIRVWVFQDCFDKETLEASICINGQAVSDAQGAYRIDKLPIGQYRISAFRNDMKDGNVFPIAIRYSRQVLVADITFRGGFGTVKGRVLRACGTPPCADTPLPAKVSISGDRLVVAGGKIGVKFEYVQNFDVVDNDFTTGEYEFRNKVYTGPFTVRAAGQFSPEPVAAEGTMPGPGATVTIDLRLQATSRITGTVLESDGFSPVTNRQVALRFHSNAVVVICHDNPDSGDSECTSIPQGIQEAFAATDGEGRFSFPLVNAGPFTIEVTDVTTGKAAVINGTVRPGEDVDVPIRLLGRANVTVRVFRSNGVTPIPNATVELQGLDYPRQHRQGVAGPDGTIVFGGGDALSEGQFVVTALDQNGFAGRKAGRVTTDGTGVVVDVFLFDATGTVNGQVLREDANAALVAVPNAEVILSTASGPIAFALTDAQGAFSVPLVPTGNVTAEAFDPVTAGRGRASGVVLGGTQTTSMTLTLEALGSIRGTLVQSGSLQPLKGWTVQLNQQTFGGRSLPTQIAQSGVDGSFAFPGASVGNFQIVATRRGIVGQGQVAGQVSRGGQLVDVPIVVTIERRVTGTVTGTVVNGGGAPAPNAQVEICAWPDPCRGTVGGADGRFSLSDVPLGRFTVRASAQVTGNPSVGTNGGVIYFEDDTADVTVTLLGLSGIDGTVYEVINNARVPAANASVRLFGQPGSGCPGACQQSTDANGNFRFINVPARTFSIVATSLTGQQGSLGDVLNPGESRSGLQVLLAPAVSVSGRSLLSNGSPAGGVVADLSVGGGHLFAETAADGTFTFEGVGAGTYALLLQDPVGGGLARRNGTVVLSGPLALGDITLDDVAPAVVSSTPPLGAINVPRTTEIRVLFTESLAASSVNAASVTLVGPAGPVVGLVDTLTNDTEVRFRLLPGVQLADQAKYTIRVHGVTDRVGRALGNDFVASFTTVDITAPSIVEAAPTTSGSGVAIDTTIRIKFSEIIDPAKFAGVPIEVTGPQGPVAGRIDYLFSNTVVVFTPNLPLLDTSRYTVKVLKATDLTGLVGANDLTYAFDTTDRTPPAIVSLTLDGGPTAVQDTTVRARAGVAETDIAVVDFFLNGTFAFAARTTPFVMDFKAAASLVDVDGQIKVTAIATDTSGNRGVVPVQAALTVVPDQAPTVAVTQPLAGLSPGPGERVNVSLHATDDVGVKELSYSARGLVVIDAATRQISPTAQDRNETFGFNVPVDAVPGSTITIQGSALDTAGHVVQATPVVLRVRDTVGPTVEITGISSGQRVAPGATITAVVSASDVSGVSRIGFVVSGVTASTTDRQVVPVQSPVVTSFQFVVPANATSADRVFLDAYAEDGAGNRRDAARLIVPVADRQAPTVTLRTATGTNTMVPGGTVQVIADAQDDLAIATIQLTGVGAFAYTDTRSLPVQTASATATFTLNIPNTLVNGDIETVTARTTDASGNLSTPVSLTLTAQTASTVTMPPSVLMLAGDETTVNVTLGTPAPAGGVRVDLASLSNGVASVTPALFFGQGDVTMSATVRAVSGGTTQIDAAISGTPRATTTVTVIGGVVRGDVSVATDTGFQPVGGAQVTVFHNGTPLTAVTDAQGRFVVEGVRGGSYSGRTFSVSASDGARLDVESFELDVPNGSATVSLNLLEMGVVQGTVYQPDVITTAAAGVQVDLFEAAAPNVVIATTFTDASGNYQFPLVAPGPYIVDASDAVGNRGRASAQLSSGQQLSVPVVYLGRATVTVHVVNGVGANVAGAVVRMQSSSLFGGAPVRTGNTDAAGLVSFPNVFVGSVSATATDVLTNRGGSSSGQVTANGQATTLTIQFAQYGNLTGTILRRDGITTAPGAQVSADFGYLGRFSTAADANGVYRFEFLPFGSFTLTVFDAATRGRAIDSGSFSTSGETLTRNETLLPQGALLVSVVDADGQPVNGASVTASTSSQGLTDSLQGATGVVNGNAGQLLLDKLLAGGFTVQVSASGLTGSATGVLVADDVHAVTVQLEARATVAGSVFDPDGQTPAAGVARVINQVSGQRTDAALVNGAFSVPNLRLGSYRVDAYDSNNRFRARSASLVLASNGQVQQTSLTFVGLGSVQGRVLHPTGGDVGNLTVALRSLDPTFGGYAQTRTDAAGNYVFTGVAVGGVSLSSSKASEQFLGEATGTIAQHNQVLSLDILLQPNAVNLPLTLTDVQGSVYGIASNGGLYGGTGSVFYAGSGGTALTLTSGGATAEFGPAPFGTQEEAGREIAVRKDALLGLNVTRKIFVPATGYFARYLEELQNPTGGPITVDVRIASTMYSGRNLYCSGGLFCDYKHYISTTSSGDSTLDVSSPATADRWVALGAGGPGDPYYNGATGTPLAFAFAGSNAAAPATIATFSAGTASQYTSIPSSLTYGWSSVTIPANGTVTLMHFVSEQASTAGAAASAQRLSTLPPEALAGLSQVEIATIANFAVPADGSSPIAPLPDVTGVVTGRVLEGDSATPVSGATVSLRSLEPVFAREQRTTSNGSGDFTFSGGPGHPVPLAGFTLTAAHPVGIYTTSPATPAAFGQGQTSAAQNVVFSNSGILTGVLRRHSGLPVAGAVVQLDGFAYTTTGANGRYSFGGMGAGNHNLFGYVNHAQGTSLNIVGQSVALVAGQVRDDVLLVEPTGTVAGTVLDADGNVQVGRPVTLSRTNFARYTSTDSAGRFTFTDVPVGTFTASGSDPVSGFPISQQVTLAQDETQDVTLRYLGKGTLNVTVTRSTGVLLPGMNVSVSAAGVNTQTRPTNASGVAGPFTDLPLGQLFTITASHPGQPYVLQVSTTLTLANNAAAVTLAMPAFGTVTTTVSRPNGTLPGAGIAAYLQNSGGNGFSAPGNTNASSQVAFGVVPVGRAFTISATRPPASQGAPSYSLSTAPLSLTADGEALVVPTHYPAVARVSVTVQNVAGDPIVGARLEERDTYNRYFQFRANTDVNGKVDITEVPEGAVDLRVFQPGSTTSVLELATGRVAATDDGGTVPVVVTAKSFSVTVTGTVFENDGLTGLGNVSLRIVRAVDGEVVARGCNGVSYSCYSSSTAGARGTFTFQNVASTGAGLVLQAFSPADSTTYTTPVVPVANGLITANLSLPVFTARLEGHVYAADGVTPVGGGVIFPTTFTGRSLYGATVLQDGSYTFGPAVFPIEGMRLEFNLSGLPGGKYSVNTVPFTQSGQTVTTDIVLPTGIVSTIKGTVVAGDGSTPLSNSTVELSFASGNCGGNYATCSAATDQQGRFQFLVALPNDGQFTLKAHSPKTYNTVGTVGGNGTAQGAAIDVGSITVPISLLSGFATNGPTATVANLTAFVTDANATTSFADAYNGSGSFLFYELPAGAYQLTVQNTDAATDASVGVTMPAPTSVVSGIQVQLPVVGTVQVRVFDENGYPSIGATIALQRPSGNFERIIGAYQGGFDQYRFADVALGDYTVQGTLEVCDQDQNCQTRYAETTVSVVDETQVETTLSFAAAPQAIVSVLDSSGQTRPSTDVQVSVTSLAATGPLGVFSTSFAATTDAFGEVHIPYVPEGGFSVSVTGPDGDVGTATATASAASPVVVAVQLSFDAFALDGNTYQGLNIPSADRYHTFDRTGTLRASYRWDGTQTYEANAFYSALELSIGGEAVCCALSASYSDNWTELAFGPVAVAKVPGVVQARRLRGLQAGNLVRVLDTFTNTSPKTQTFTVSQLVSVRDSRTLVTNVAPSAVTGGLLALRDPGGQSPAFGVVFAGIDAPLMPGPASSTGASGYAMPTSLTLLPGQSVALLNYLIMRGPADSAGVLAEADALTTLNEPEMLAGLSRADIIRIANFRITPPPPGPAKVRVTVIGRDGLPTTGASVALVGTASIDAREPYQVTNGAFEFLNVAPGAYLVQGSLDSCDLNGCGLYFAEAPVNPVADEVVSLVLSFANLGHATIRVLDQASLPMAFENVDIDLQSLAAGPSGSYHQSFNVTLGADGLFPVDTLPPGPFVVHVHSASRDQSGVSTGTATTLVPTATDVTLRSGVIGLATSAFFLSGADGFYYLIDSHGEVQRGYALEGADFVRGGAFAYQGQLHSGAPEACCPVAADIVEREAILAPVPVPGSPGVIVNRRLMVPEAGRFLRYFDLFTNTSNVTRTVPVSLWTAPDKSVGVAADVTPGASTGGYFVGADPAQQELSYGIVYSGVDPPQVMQRLFSPDQSIVQPTTQLQLAPGQSAALLHYVLLRAPGAVGTAVADADALATLTEPQMLDGLSPEELQLVVNFRVTPPPPGPSKVSVTVFGFDGLQTTSSAVALVGDGQTVDTRQPYQDAGGVFDFAPVVAGHYVVQASLERCDGNGCVTFFADAPVVAPAGRTARVVLSFASLGHARIAVVDDTAQPMAFENVELELQSLSSVGPLGGFETSINATLDADGSVTLDQVPPGAFVVHVFSAPRGLSGVSIGSATRLTATTTQVALSQDVVRLTNSSVVLTGADGFYYIVGSAGTAQQSFYYDGAQLLYPDAFSLEGAPYNGSTGICCPLAVTSAGNEAVLSPVSLPVSPGVVMTRRLLLPSGGRFMRYYDLFTNTSAVAQSVPVSLWTTPNLSRVTVADVTPSPTTGGYFVAADANGSGLAFASVYAGIDPPVALQRLFSNDLSTFEPTTTLQLAPGQSRALLHYVVLRAPDGAGDAIAGAEALSALTDPEALLGLSASDLAVIANFRTTP